MKPLFVRRRFQTAALLLLLSPASAFALICKTQGAGETFVHGQLSSTVAIPATVPNGEVVWRSGPMNIQVECAKDGQQALQEEIALYLNPDNIVIGQGIRAGLTHKGIDYVQGSGRITTGHYLPACHEGDANIDKCPRVRFNLPFSVFIQKFGATPPSGVASDLLDYRFFQLDSAAGLQPLPGRSLSYVIDSLTGLRFVACDADLQVIPQTVEFGALPIKNVAAGKVFATQPFSLLTQRTCDSPFSINARFRPVSGIVSDSGDMLIPAGNPSLGIRISGALGGKALRYNEPFHMAELLDDTHAAKADFNAELVWSSTRPQVGPFDAQIMVDLFYR
ncbi:fimbrial protein [Pseudomonas sp. 20GA0080]|uniref:fimbrial protein n=1 Tax=Pseudomonas alliivorans TaxID=2810613 RepID=UPI001AE96CFB|nr:fimbrial protein [Pseudomonas alliivorans]MBP0952726.1 fimbrial protein [Pseudomonas alliivorans]